MWPARAFQTPASVGPMPFLPGSTEWHALHTANEAGSAIGAPAAAAGVVAAAVVAAAVGVGAGLGVSVGVGSPVGVSSPVRASPSTGATVSTGAAAVSEAVGVLSSLLPPPQAVSANRTVARAAAVFGGHVIRNPQVDRTEFRRLLSPDRALGKALASPLCDRGASGRANLLAKSRLCFQLQPPAPIRPSFHVARIPLHLARRAGRYPAPRGAAGGCQPAADAGLRGRRDLRRPPRRAGPGGGEPV